MTYPTKEALEAMLVQQTAAVAEAVSQGLALDTINSNIALILAAQQALAQRAMSGVPATATPFSATNTTDVTSTSVQVVRAAVTAKKKWITEITVTNKTAAELPVITVEDNTGTPVVIDTFAPGDPAAGRGSERRTYSPPIEVAAGKQIGAHAGSSVGDVLVTVSGFEQA